GVTFAPGAAQPERTVGPPAARRDVVALGDPPGWRNRRTGTSAQPGGREANDVFDYLIVAPGSRAACWPSGWRRRRGRRSWSSTGACISAATPTITTTTPGS